MAISQPTGRSRATLVLLVLTSVTLLTLDARGTAPTEGLREAASTVIGPIRSAGDGVSEPIEDAWDGIVRSNELEEENDRLRREVDELRGDQVTDQVAEQQLAELEKLEGITFINEIPTVTARVVSGPLSSFDATVEIDKGSGDGLEEGMAVVTPAGLMGRLEEVFGGRSLVQLVSDPGFEFGVRLVRTGELGIAHGASDEGLLVDQGIARKADVKKGDVVTTSGVERSAFPPDIPVGRVTEVRPTADQAERSLVIEPAADVSGLGHVKVVMWEND